MPVTISDYDPAVALTSPAAIEVFLNEAFATGHAGYIAHALTVVTRAKGLSPGTGETNPSLETTLAVLKAVGFEIAGKCAVPAA